ncbi:tetratricopeptide repeat protein [Occallatibacter riparius]|uniref:Tetratricopeptide repeat protein n=1 Tax=Occallatibacter riparius TaxID=1002689 RepID=A0A9J7BNN9_9BACT|nr:tetratricopeptide repeat protein [Occallatibacter riparius]UWZ84347.1 tetratricopeptide repeat protein [Occallatibacter riparius]
MTLALCLAATAAVGQQSSYTIQRQQALALEQQRNFSEAESAWQTLSKTHPENPEPYAHIAVLEARQEHYKEAIPLYRKALEMNPHVPGLRFNLALALFKDGQLKEAIPEFSALLKTAPPNSPDSQRLTILLGMSHYGLAEYAEAVPFLKQAAGNDAQNLPLRLALAHSCLWSKQMQCVMDVYHEILNLNAESAEADMLAGEALDEMKDNEGSTKMFRAAVKANPKEPNVHFGLGYLLWTQKQYPEAATEFQAELANDPAHAQAMLYLGDTYLQLNKQEEARLLLQKAVGLDSSLWLAHLDLGIIDSDAGRNDDALRELLAAAKLKDDDVNVHWRLARLYRTIGKKDEAKVEFDKASKLNKAADEDLYRKIANGRQRPPESSPPAAVAPNP